MARAGNIANQGFHTNPERINRKGRPRKLPELDQLIIELLGEKGKESRMREVLASLIELAVGGNIRAAEVILNRAYGKVRDVVDVNLAGQSDDKPKIIPSCDGTFKDEFGNTIGTISPDKMKDFNFQIVFVGNDDDGDDEIHGYAGKSLGYNVRDENGDITQLPPQLEQWDKRGGHVNIVQGSGG